MLLLLLFWLAGTFVRRTRRFGLLQNRTERQNERVTAPAQFMKTFVHDPLDGALPAREQDHTKLPMVASARCAADKTSRRKSIDQPHRAVMPEKQAFRQAADAGLATIRKPADGQ